MSWPDTQPESTTDPAYYHDAADPREAELRADFTRFHQLRLIAPFGETPDQVTEFMNQAHDLAAKWRNAGHAEQRLWTQLDAASATFQSRPVTAVGAYGTLAQARAAGDPTVDELTWRTLRQAAQITGRIEPGINGSTQDGARSRPQDRSAGRTADPASVLDRALGGRGPEITSLAEVDAIIAATDDLLAAEEHHGDRDTGAVEREVTQRAALRRVQDLTAEHTRTSERFAGVVSHDQDLLGRLEDLLGQVRDARIEAATAGATQPDIDAAYIAGRDGTYTHHNTTETVAVNDTNLTSGVDAAIAAAMTDLDQVGEQPSSDADTDMAPEYGIDPDLGVAV
ncbi:phytochrome family protein [Nocardia aurea]|uniref:hypothetical protein n=1 Tax=Nocardia aurea TaxID=2144174 RepID=UPI000D6909D2|nr:hypothetical protein [Nocardia aurea]